MKSPVLRRSLVWSLFIVCVMAAATMNASASMRLLGPPDVEASPTPPDVCTQAKDAASIEDCQRQPSYQAYLAALRKVQGAAADVCAGLSDDASRDACHRWGDPSAADACSGASGECSFQPAVQVCASAPCGDMLTRNAMNAQLLIPGTPLPCPGYDPSLPAPDSCPPGTPRPSPPLCQGISAPYPHCTGN
jgi:hypothetical protein